MAVKDQLALAVHGHTSTAPIIIMAMHHQGNSHALELENMVASPRRLRFLFVAVAIGKAKHRPPPRCLLALTRPCDATDACPPLVETGNGTPQTRHALLSCFVSLFPVYPSAFLPLANSFVLQ